MRTRVLGVHNLETKATRHTCFLIDDILAIDAGSLVSALSHDELLGLQTLLLTHHHFDHVRDVPTLGLIIRDADSSITLAGIPETIAGVQRNLLNGDVYPNLLEPLNDDPPRFRQHLLETNAQQKLAGYTITPLPMRHAVPAVGYIVRAPSGQTVGFSGDTGGGLDAFFMNETPPGALFVDMTFPNRMEHIAQITGHLTPGILGRELRSAMEAGMRLPRIVPVHRGLGADDELLRELDQVSKELGVDLSPGYQEMVV